MLSREGRTARPHADRLAIIAGFSNCVIVDMQTATNRLKLAFVRNLYLPSGEIVHVSSKKSNSLRFVHRTLREQKVGSFFVGIYSDLHKIV